MTTFIISHNLQIVATNIPAFKPDELVDGLLKQNESFQSITALIHPHWLLRLESTLEVQELAEALLAAWRGVRLSNGHEFNHTVMALGGRKDDKAIPNSPLQTGCWGVDLVETLDGPAFLRSINWDALKSGRPADAVFEQILNAN
jgi:hypothetical protein